MPAVPARTRSDWDPRYTRMMVVSAVAHVAVLLAIVAGSRYRPEPPLSMTAYTVELTDGHELGGVAPPGRLGRDLSGGATVPAPARDNPGAGGGDKPAAEEAKQGTDVAPPPEPIALPKPEPPQ